MTLCGFLTVTGQTSILKLVKMLFEGYGTISKQCTETSFYKVYTLDTCFSVFNFSPESTSTPVITGLHISQSFYFRSVFCALFFCRCVFLLLLLFCFYYVLQSQSLPKIHHSTI